MPTCIAIGSQSRIKIEAVKTALRRMGFVAAAVEIRTLDVPSGVPVQPEGLEQTVKGARRRARTMKESLPDAYAIGIENGIRREDDGAKDWAVVVVVAPDGREFIAHSEALHLPASAVSEARRRGFAKTTVGQILAERLGGASDDPHSTLVGRPREEFLAAAVETALRHFLRVVSAEAPRSPAMSKHVPSSVPVQIGGHTFELPVREIKPGLSVALFNPLGDWKVCEIAGVELAKLVPDGVDILVMPDGKAQALLHVVGRQTGKPTVVARKEAKPYMGEVVRVEVQSITTRQKQILCLSRADAEFLRGKKVAIVDDVVSTGGTLLALKDLMKMVGAEVVAVMAVLTEGVHRDDVIALGHVPLFTE